MWLADVAPLRRMPNAIDFLTYEIPSQEISDPIDRGALIEVPLRNAITPALVLRVYEKDVDVGTPQNTSSKKFAYKPITRSLNIQIPEYLVSILEDAAEYFAVTVPYLADALIPVPGKRAIKAALETPASNKNSISPQDAKSNSATKKILIQTTSNEESTQEAIKLLKAAKQSGTSLHFLVPTLEDANTLAAALKPHGEISLATSEVAAGKLWEIFTSNSDALISTRSGILFPLPNRSAIVILNDESSDHKQWDMKPRYDARTLAHMLAEKTDCALYVISQTPRLQTYKDFTSQSVLHTIPNIVVHVNPDTKNPISQPTQDAIEAAEDAGKKVITLPEFPYEKIPELAEADLVVLQYPDRLLYGNEWSAEERLYAKLIHLANQLKSTATLILVAATPHRVFAGLMPSRRKEYIQILLDERKDAEYPPYGSFVKIIVQSDVSLKAALDEAQTLAETLNTNTLGPYPSEPANVRGRWRALFTIHGAKDVIRKIKPKLKDLPDKVLVDIDPERIFR